MYLGEVNIAHEDLDSFLAVAQDLCIKGLTQDNNTSQNHETPSQTPMGSGSRSPAPSKRPREPKPDRGQPPSKTLKREQLVQLKQEPQQHHEAIAIDHNIVIDNANEDEGNMEAYDEYYDEEATLDNPTVDDDNKGRFIFEFSFFVLRIFWLLTLFLFLFCSALLTLMLIGEDMKYIEMKVSN